MPQDQFCWSRENQWTKIGSRLWSGMMELVDTPWRSPICRTCRLSRDLQLRTIGVIVNGPICDPTLEVPKIWVGGIFCMESAPFREKGHRLTLTSTFYLMTVLYSFLNLNLWRTIMSVRMENKYVEHMALIQVCGVAPRLAVITESLTVRWGHIGC